MSLELWAIIARLSEWKNLRFDRSSWRFLEAAFDTLTYTFAFIRPITVSRGARCGTSVNHGTLSKNYSSLAVMCVWQ